MFWQQIHIDFGILYGDSCHKASQKCLLMTCSHVYTCISYNGPSFPSSLKLFGSTSKHCCHIPKASLLPYCPASFCLDLWNVKCYEWSMEKTNMGAFSFSALSLSLLHHKALIYTRVSRKPWGSASEWDGLYLLKRAWCFHCLHITIKWSLFS